MITTKWNDQNLPVLQKDYCIMFSISSLHYSNKKWGKCVLFIVLKTFYYFFWSEIWLAIKSRENAFWLKLCCTENPILCSKCIMCFKIGVTLYGCSYLGFPGMFLGFLRKDWFATERVDIVRGDALEKVEGGVLGIFLPRWPIHFFCSSWDKARSNMSRADVTS